MTRACTLAAAVSVAATPPGAARINGKPARWRGAAPELSITEHPATIALSRSGEPKHP